QITNLRLKDILEKNPDVSVPDYVNSRLNGKYRDKPIITSLDGIAPTAVAHYAKDKSTRLVNDGFRLRPYSLLEWQRLQGFPDWF
ncbi:DNA (cytosine-5-)-methyltransferase, partial [Enterococcus faecium]